MSEPYPTLPMSRSALDNLGKRLARSDTISDTDLAALQSVITAYDELLAAVKPRVDRVVKQARNSLDLDLATPTSRPKTIGTIHDKLRREQGMGLKGMQDLAGVRVVGDMDRHQQDRFCNLLEAEFADEQATPRRVDRRETPSSGYRALHLIVFPGGMPVEIQIRTRGQQLWANVYERLADAWGRQIRYGGAPDEPDEPVDAGITRRDVIVSLQTLADQLDDIERKQVRVEELERETEGLATGTNASDEDRLELDATRSHFRTDLAEAKTAYDAAHRAILNMLASFTEWAERIG